MDIVGDLRCHHQHRRIGHEHRSRRSDHYRYFGHDQRLGNLDSDGGGFDFNLCDSQHSVGGCGLHPAIYCNRDIQQRNHAEPDLKCKLDFFEDLGSNNQQRRAGDERGSGHRDDHRNIGDDQRLGDVHGHCGSFDFNFGHSQHRIGRCGLHPAIHRDGNLQQRNDAEPNQYRYLDILGDAGCNGKQRRTCHECGAGRCDDHGHFGSDQRFGHVGGHSGSFDFPFGDSGDVVGRSRLHPAVHGHGNLQQRYHAERDFKCNLDFFEGIGRNREQRWTGYECGAGERDHHSDFGDDQRLGHIDGHGRSVDFDFSDSHGSVGGCRLHPAVYGHGNLQRRHDAEPDQYCHLDFFGDADCHGKQRRTGYERGAGKRHHHSLIGDDQRFRHVDGHARSADFAVGGAFQRDHCEWDEPAVCGDGDVQ